MDVEIEMEDETAVLRIIGGMTVFEAANLRDKLVDWFDTHESLLLDLHDVEQCDVAGIQLIYSAHKTSESMGKTFSVRNASKAVIQAVAAAGLHPEKMLNI